MLRLFVVLSALCAMAVPIPLPEFYSYSSAAGDGSGTEYSTANVGRITGIRVYEYAYYYGNYINGIQLRYDGDWTALVGVSYYGNVKEMLLFKDENFVQVSGKYYNGYVNELMFVSNLGRFIKVGQPSGNSFNLYPTHNESELRFISGRQNGFAITSIGAHWAVYYPVSNTTSS
ncbi:zymogen granule membrane protein 16-like [Xyrauchen texanus]|uniref:zymogen granule membrane protein 16-like n=1 Tax=Xyrauchen texanus TaxID=154827 RepID=UPI002241FA65|nr:zymogen granule membrane protein 16-like [Xyrauchen texanus]